MSDARGDTRPEAELETSLPSRASLFTYSFVGRHPIDTADICERVVRYIGTSVSVMSNELMSQEDGYSVETILHMVANALRYEVQARDAATQAAGREGQA